MREERNQRFFDVFRREFREEKRKNLPRNFFEKFPLKKKKKILVGFGGIYNEKVTLQLWKPLSSHCLVTLAGWRSF